MVDKGQGKAQLWVAWALEQETDSCILWPFPCKHRYPTVKRDWGNMVVSREICFLTHGEPPTETHQAAHSCHTPSCCNKRHLRWATPLENSADRAKGPRYHVGARVHTARLTEEAAREIIASSEQASVLAKKFGVSHRCVRSVRLGVSWPHLQRRQLEAGSLNGLLSFGC